MPISNRKPIAMFYPYISNEAVERVAWILRDRWIGQGAIVDEFERELESQLGLQNVVAVNTASSAIHLALSIAGVKPNDEVITTPMTCTLTNHPILQQSAIPVFADIQYDSGNLDPADIEHRITPKTKAILCTHWGGTPCDLNEIHTIAEEYGLDVIEDASEAIGATYAGRPIGSLSDFTAFSFQAIQILTTGEGGALVTLNPDHAERARIQRWYGIDRKRRKPNQIGYYDFDIETIGFGYHLTNIAAAIGSENIKLLKFMLAHRRMVADRYRKELADVPGINLLRSNSDRDSSNHFFTIHVNRREDFYRKMKQNGVEVSVVHYRNDTYSVFGGMGHDLPVLDRFSKSYIALPTHVGLTKDDVDFIISVIQSGW